jgi:hypothetical protein
VSGPSAGQTFGAAGLSDAGATVAMVDSLVYKVGNTAVSEPAVWPSLVDAFAASTSTFPSATLSVQKPAEATATWTAKLELLCASQAAAPTPGPTVVTAKNTIPVAGEPGAMAFNATTKKAYIGMTDRTDAGFTVSAGIAVIDDTTDTVTTTITTTNPAVALAANATTSKVYASERTKIDIIDSTTDAITATIDSISGTYEGVAVNESANLVYLLTSTAKIFVLDGSTHTVTNVATPYTLTGINVPNALFSGGKPSIAFDPTGAGTLYVIGLDSGLNGVMVSLNASNGQVINTYGLTGAQPQSITVVPGVGAVATVAVLADLSNGLVLFGQTTSTSPGFSHAVAVATCGTSVDAFGFDDTGNAAFAGYTPAGAALGTPTSFDASELTENGYVPVGLLAGPSAGGGCTFYGSYSYNSNAAYTSGLYTPPAPHYVVKFVNH